MFRRSLLLLVVVALSLHVFAQGTTATLVGTVTTDGKPLPGVTVTATSPLLLGSRTTVSGTNGDYILGALPPGPYAISFELEGMQSLNRRAELRLAETGRSDADLKVAAVAESITVTAVSPSILETPQISTNLDAKLIEELAIGRRIQDRIQLAPGVNASGTNGQTTIHGAQSFDNLYLVNGVVINENVRGQPQNAVIEDAIQETTLLTGGVSAEFGRFTGGVVSTITKSGGNDFSGSLRSNLTNDRWSEKTAFRDPVSGARQRDLLDKINPIYEATLGGRVIRDRLWFFGAGRGEKSSLSNQTAGLNLPFTTTRDQKRYEGKLTGQITKSHTLVGSYFNVKDPQTNTFFGNIVDLASLRAIEGDIQLLSGHYTGVLTRNLFVEAQYSKKDSTTIGGGSAARDEIFGTLLRDVGTGRRAWSPTFCGVCRNKERDNKEYAASATWFLSTARTGSHNIVSGYDQFHELRTEDNYQSGSDFRLFGDFIYSGTRLFFHLDPSLNNAGISRSRIQWDPLLGKSQTSDFTTNSWFVNDKWSFNNHLNFNVGARFDANDGKNQAGVKTTDDSRFSPRLGAVYDVRADGRLRLSATYGRYVAKIDQGPADSTATAGRYATYLFQYRGPELNAPGTPANQLLPTEEVIRRAFDWFHSQGGASTSSPLIFSAIVPGLNQKILQPLKSPFMDEVAFGVGTQIGGNGVFRADLIHREWSDFYIVRKDLTTGRTPDGKLDIGLIENGSNGFDRTYNALQLQAEYKFLGRFRFGGNYTFSKLRGNVEGEEFNNATVPVGVIQPGGNEVFETPHFPEYTGFAQNRPVGYLSADVRHRLNGWVSFEAPVPFGHLNLSLFERYHTGVPFSAIGSVNPQQSTSLPGGVVNPGYAKPPSAVNYYFSKRGAYRLDTISETNLNATYSFPVSKINFFFKADLLNAFNEQGVENAENPNSTAGTVIERRVRTRVTGAKFLSGADALPFNPFTTAPAEGLHYELDPNFGKATNKDAYQLPRTYRVAVGLRF